MRGKGCLIGGGAFIVVIIVLVLIIAGSVVPIYNNIKTKNNEVEGKWANVESAYQRRADLIPNLVNTVKGYANFEQETLTEVTAARASASALNVDPSKLTPEMIAQYQSKQDQLSSALGRLLVTVEKYPDLKANQNFLALQSQLEGTENRIKIERDAYNSQVVDFNNYVDTLPNSIVAGFMDEKNKGVFKAAAGTENVPQVNFTK